MSSLPPMLQTLLSRRRFEAFLVAGLLGLIGWSYYFALPPNFRQLRFPVPDGYYGLQTEAFLAGQLHLKVRVDPLLLTLENPYAGPQGANRPHDMSYYRGRFYLYYGATPVLLLFLPWRLLTGGYLAESLGSVMMLYGGVILGAVWLVSARRQWFPSLSISWVLLLIAVIGFGPPLFSSATNNTFYGVPIACAFFCLMVAFTAACQALSSQRLGVQAGCLATASLFWGLAVGARPIYVLGLTMLALPAAYLWWKSGREMRWRWPGLRLLAAMLVPAALVGLAMMTYNYLRFDNPFDFGIRFSMASGDLREARLVGPEFIGKNLYLYLLQTASIVRYYPFIIVDSHTWGILPHLTLAALGALFPLTLLYPTLRNPRWMLAGALLAGAAVANLGLLCLFFGQEERYLLDFVPALLVLAAMTALAMLELASRGSSRLGAWFIRLLVGGLAAHALLNGLLLTLPRHDGTKDRLWFERLLNTPTHLLETRFGTEYGPLEMEVVFPRNRTGVIEPLLVTGLGKHGVDGVMVRYLDETHAQFSAFHLGRGGPVSEPIEIDYGVPHRVRIALGSLYPPANHPLFADWPPSLASRIRRRLKIDVDGRTALQGNFTVHPSVPSGIQVGRSDLPSDVSTPDFTGKIIRQRRLGVDAQEVAGLENIAGPRRLTVRFPPRAGDEGLPLVVTGKDHHGDLLFVQLLEGNLVRVGHDSFGGGAVLSPAVPYTPDQDQVLDVEMGSLYPEGAADVSPYHRQRLRVSLNGHTLIDTSRPFNPANLEETEFGFNTIKASTAIDYFPGAIRKIERIPPHQPDAQTWGELRLAVVFPSALATTAEPLVVTGHTGRADLLFVRYEPDGRIRFGVDHWGIGTSQGEPLQVDRNQTHLIEVLSGALLPPENDVRWAGRNPVEAERLRNRLEVRLNGLLVLTSEFAPYSNASGEISIGTNLIGASTSEPRFSGQILLVERLPW